MAGTQADTVGSIAAWLSERVGRTGLVIATDLDTRLIDALRSPNLEVRQQDVARDDLPVGEFDLVHPRALLAHLPERDDVLRKMAGALRPGVGYFVKTSTRAPAHKGRDRAGRVFELLGRLVLPTHG